MLKYVKYIRGRVHDSYCRYIYERPSERYRRRVERPVQGRAFQQHAMELCRDGITIVPGYFADSRLDTMREEFETIICRCDAKPDSIGKIDLHFSALYESRSLSEAAIDPFLISIVAYYWGKPVYLSCCDGRRILPYNGNTDDVKGWHHDTKRKLVKIMVLLTDVPEDGQRMDYIPGTHKIWHRNLNYEDTRFTAEAADCFGRPVPCSGPAGSAVIFDANGIHAPNRNRGPGRDTWTFYYTGGKHLSPVRLHPEIARSLNPNQDNILRMRQ